MAVRPITPVALSTSYLGSEQTGGVGARYLEFVLADASIAWTLRITGSDGVTYTVELAAGQGWQTPAPPADLGTGWTWNAKSASGTPSVQILSVY